MQSRNSLCTFALTNKNNNLNNETMTAKRSTVTKHYILSELTEEAKRIAHKEWMEGYGYPNDTHYANTLDTFSDQFGFEVRDADYDEEDYTFGGVSIYDEDMEDLRGQELENHLQTTYPDRKPQLDKQHHSMDDIILTPIHEFLQHPEKDLGYEELMGRCVGALLKACHEAVKQETSYETFIANNLTYKTLLTLSKKKEENECMESEQLVKYKRLVDTHDIYYSMSDDDISYRRGKAQWELIQNTFLTLSEAEKLIADEYFNKRIGK